MRRRPTASRPAACSPAGPAASRCAWTTSRARSTCCSGLISKHKLDVTEIALSQVTDDFIAYIGPRGTEWDLGEASEFLLVAATLLDLKAARLLPAAEVEDDEDLALLEARDLLFARLLQYRAFKEVAATFAGRLATRRGGSRARCRWSRSSRSCCPSWCSASRRRQFAMIAAKALTPQAGADGDARPPARAGGQRPRAGRRSSSTGCAGCAPSSFRALVADADGTVVVVARFLALLELFREGAVVFDQVTPLGELTVRWTGPTRATSTVEDEFDDADGASSAWRTRRSGARRAHRPRRGMMAPWTTTTDDRPWPDGGRPAATPEPARTRPRGRRPPTRPRRPAEEPPAIDVDAFPAVPAARSRRC